MLIKTNPIIVELDLEESIATARLLNAVIAESHSDSSNERTIEVLKGVVERIRNAIIDDLDRAIKPKEE